MRRGLGKTEALARYPKVRVGQRRSVQKLPVQPLKALHEKIIPGYRRQRRGARPPPPIGGGFRTAIDRYCQMVTINVFYKNSRVKQYLKDGVALRIETVINSPMTWAAAARSATCPTNVKGVAPKVP